MHGVVKLIITVSLKEDYRVYIFDFNDWTAAHNAGNIVKGAWKVVPGISVEYNVIEDKPK